MHTITSPAAPTIDTPKKSLKTRRPSIELWRPAIVLAHAQRPVAPRPAVALGEPALRPDAVRAQIEATRTLLASLEATRAALGVEAAAAEERARGAASEAERVTAMMDTYRLKTRLDDALRGAYREITALMEERGLR